MLLLETEAAEEDYEEAEVAVDQIDQDLTKIKGLEMISSEPEKVPTQSKSEIADKDNNNKRTKKEVAEEDSPMTETIGLREDLTDQIDHRVTTSSREDHRTVEINR